MPERKILFNIIVNNNHHAGLSSPVGMGIEHQVQLPGSTITSRCDFQPEIDSSCVNEYLA